MGIYLGLGINGIDLNIPNNRTFKRYTRENIPELEGDFINSACEDVINHGIWFGSTRGVHFYDKRKDTFVRVLFDQSDNEFEAIYALLIDSKKRLWVGTTQGVFIVDLASFAKSNKRFIISISSINWIIRSPLNWKRSTVFWKTKTVPSAG